MDKNLKDKLRQQGQARYLQILKNIPAIDFIAFKEITDQWVIFWEGARRISIIDKAPQADVVDWLKGILASEGIVGEYFLSFADNNYRSLPFARVSLGEAYEWLEPIWSLGNLLNIVSVEMDYDLVVKSTEECMSGRCYAAYVGKRYVGANDFLASFHASLAALLQNHLRGVYVIGSLALGDFNPETSDIDFIIVTDTAIDDAMFAKLQQFHADFAASDSKWAQKIEAVYVTEAVLRQIDEQEYPQLEKDVPFFKAKLEDGWIFQLYTLREHPIIIAGDHPRTLIPPIDPREMKAPVQVIAGTWLEQSRSDPEWLNWVRSCENQAFVVFTLCRMLYSLATGSVTSKPAAAKWAQETLPPRWSSLIANTLTKQHEHGDISQAELDETVAFVAYTVEQAH